MEVVHIFESKLFNNDTDFEDEEQKEVYYYDEFWEASDHLIIPETDGNWTLNFRIIEDEIVVDNDDLNEDIIELLERFASDDFKEYFDELQTGNDYNVKDDPLYDNNKPFILYRGGEGYNYYYHQYKIEI